MRSIDEQLNEILKRSDDVIENRRIRKNMLVEGVMSCICMALLVITILYIPSAENTSAQIADGRYGSLILDTAGMGYVVVGVLAILMGILATLLIQNILKYKKK